MTDIDLDVVRNDTSGSFRIQQSDHVRCPQIFYINKTNPVEASLNRSCPKSVTEYQQRFSRISLIYEPDSDSDFIRFCQNLTKSNRILSESGSLDFDCSDGLLSVYRIPLQFCNILYPFCLNPVVETALESRIEIGSKQIEIAKNRSKIFDIQQVSDVEMIDLSFTG